jgi:hypothetical protein
MVFDNSGQREEGSPEVESGALVQAKEDIIRIIPIICVRVLVFIRCFIQSGSFRIRSTIYKNMGRISPACSRFT